ncbi:hypothetical protein [uncultured Maricaulis sp.]|uniref:hypothetical protein n=1 Tax=uncultured Maricaulis sp. TaxID=174710 RepID=UPI0030D94185
MSMWSNVETEGGIGPRAPWVAEAGETVLREVKVDVSGDVQSHGRVRLTGAVTILMGVGFGAWAFWRLWLFMQMDGWIVLRHLDLYPVTLLAEGLKYLLIGLLCWAGAIYFAWAVRKVLQGEPVDRHIFTDRRVLTVGVEGGVYEEIRVSDIGAARVIEAAGRNRFCLVRREGVEGKYPFWIDPVENIEPVLDFLRRTYRIPVEREDASKKRGR